MSSYSRYDPPYEPPYEPPTYNPPRSNLPLVAAAVAGALFTGGGLAYVYKNVFPPAPPQPPSTLEYRVDRLTESLRSAASSIAAIETEIAYRRQLAEKLQADAATAEKLRTLNRDQVNAIAQTLQGQLRQREAETWWAEFGLNVAYAIFGAVVGQFPWLFDLWRRRRQR